MLAISAFFDYEIWQMDVKPRSLMVTLRKSCTWYSPKVLLILRMLTRYANFSDPFMD
jgi:hypothetical protein